MKISRVIVSSAAHAAQGAQLAARFAVPCIDGTALAEAKPREVERFVRAQLRHNFDAQAAYVFLLTAEGLSLVQVDAAQILSIRADFYGPTVSYRRHKGGGKGQMIAKAVGLASGGALNVLDATAGLGRDAFVLASLGASVTMIERVPEVRALLEDALSVAQTWAEEHDPALGAIMTRMTLVEADALAYMSDLEEEASPDVVYLDPMFPVRNKSAQVKKEMRVFHDLVGTDPDAGPLLDAAMEIAQKRVVVKRPRVAPHLNSIRPSHVLEGKSNRFDVYICC